MVIEKTDEVGQALDQDAGDSAAHTPTDSTSWLLAHKVQLPDPVMGYVERPELETLCSPLARRLTVLHAPGGFGKTALLARCCHRLREEGVPVAWLGVDEDDGPVSMASYLSLAFERAGVRVHDEGPVDAEAAAEYATDAAADSPAAYRINLLMRAIRHHRAPCVLALDEVDRLCDPDAVAALNLVLDRAPRNLHFAMAFRERPHGLGVAMFELEGHGRTLTAEDLRFSTGQIARFFEPRLSRAQLASAAAHSSGWPIALCLYRNALEAGAPVGELRTSDTVAAWIETRLWRGLSDSEREFVLDIALFDWLEPKLIDEATGRSQSKLRLGAMQSLSGLLQTAGGDRSAMRLHPLVREYCVNKLFRDNPQRFRTIHVGIARALARRGQVLDALRHASEAGDSALIGVIAEQAGGVRLWILRGPDALRALNGWLTQDVVASHPRLALVRCVALICSGDMEGARRVYRAAADKSADFTLDASGQEDGELRTDHLFALGVFAVLGCSLLPRYDPLVAQVQGMAGQADLDPLLRGSLELGMCMAHNEMAEFDEAARWADCALADVGSAAQFALPHIHFQLGVTAMARGHTEEAQRRYDRGLNIAQGHIGDTGMVMKGGLLKAELELERCAGAPLLATTPVSVRLLGEYAAWFDIYAASVGVAAELAWHHGNLDTAIAGVEQAREFARATDRAALARLFSAQRVSLLLAGSRVDEGIRAWRADQLPDSTEQCLDLRTQRWREMEAIACARLRLLIAQGEFEAAREFAAEFRAVATRRSLARTLMRALSLSARLDFQAGDRANATVHIVGALRLFGRADYARPLARERDVVVPLLDELIGSTDAGPDVLAAQDMRAALTTPDSATDRRAQRLPSQRELLVLRRLSSHTDKEIARDLGISYDAVRYYVRKIFARVKANNRYEAVHRARAIGLLSGEGADNAFDG